MNLGRMIRAARTAILCGAAIGQLNLVAEDWPNWRGPAHNGISREKDWLRQWPDEGPKTLWKAKVGLGYTSIVVGGGKACTVGHADEEDTIYCFDAETGKQIWKYAYPSDLGAKYFDGGTTGTPTIDGDRLYWLSRWGDLFCFELANGKVVWKRNVQKEENSPVPTWGFTGAPAVHGQLLLLNVGDAGMAVDKRTGKTVWESDDKDPGYSTPLPVERGGKTYALLGSSKSYVAVETATGKEAWRFPWNTQYGVNAADPIISGDLVFISTGYKKGAALIKPWNGEPETVWQSKVLRTQLNPGVLWNGHVYGVDGDTVEKATLKCIELSSGKELWSERGIGSGAATLADGQLIVISDKGELMVAPATPEGFKPTARAQVLGGTVWTAPVLANGIIYCRNSRGDIAAVDVRKN